MQISIESFPHNHNQQSQLKVNDLNLSILYTTFHQTTSQQKTNIMNY